MSSRAARSNNGCLTNSRICTWYVMMDPKITPSGQTIVKPTALGPVANTDTKLLIYDLFQKGRVLAQNDHQVATLLSDGRVEVEGVPYARLSEAAAAITGKRTNGWWFFLTDQASRRSLRVIRREYIDAMAVDVEDDEVDDENGDEE